MDQPLRIGLVGAGMVSRHHLIAWASLSDQARVVAIADPRSTVLSSLRRERSALESGTCLTSTTMFIALPGPPALVNAR